MKNLKLMLIVSLLSMLFFACQSSNEKKTEDVIESVTGKDVDIETNENEEIAKMTVKGENGESVTIQTSGNKVPDNFPDDIYLVKGDIKSAGSMASEDKEIITIAIIPQNDFDNVVQEIKKEMKSREWTSGMNMDMGDQAILNYTKGKNNVTITINKDEDNNVEVGYMAAIAK